MNTCMLPIPVIFYHISHSAIRYCRMIVAFTFEIIEYFPGSSISKPSAFEVIFQFGCVFKCIGQAYFAEFYIVGIDG